MFKLPFVARLIGALTGQTDALRAAMLAPAITGRPAGVWMGLGHHGQPPARGIVGGPAKQRVGQKPLSRRDKHRAIAAFKRYSTRPDFSAQIAREAKQARSRKARQRAAGN